MLLLCRSSLENRRINHDTYPGPESHYYQPVEVQHHQQQQRYYSHQFNTLQANSYVSHNTNTGGYAIMAGRPCENGDDPGIHRSDSQASDAATVPLTDNEYGVLQTEIDNMGANSSTFGNLLNTPSTSQASTGDHNWQQQTTTAFSRGDTLDRIPGVVDPRTIHNVKMELSPADHDQNIVFNDDQTVTVTTEMNIWGDLENIELQQMPIQQLAPIPPPTSASPSAMPWPGEYAFKVSFQRLTQSTKNKCWDFSESLNKLFIDMNKHVLATFNVSSNPPDGLLIRALPIYAVAGFLQDPVKRCPNHASLNDASNVGFPEEFVDHLIRVNNDATYYVEDPTSKRLSAVVPVQRPQAGTDTFSFPLKFMCLGSDVGGINRKPLQVIFTLEHGTGNVVGRCVVDVRICSCPKRDRAQEENRMSNEEKKFKTVADGLARANSSLVFTHPQSSKKRRIEKDVEDMIMVPVAKADFQKVNEIAEALTIARHVDKVPEIKVQRKRLLITHNPNVFTPKVKPREENKS